MKNPDDRATARQRARSLRENQTRSEGLLWTILRARQVCGLKFRRQHPISHWIVDFACPQKMLVVEIDGGYHDEIGAEDKRRQECLEQLGWTVVRFTDKDVEHDAESVARGIAKAVKLPYQFKRRQNTGAGMRSEFASKPKRPGGTSPR